MFEAFEAEAAGPFAAAVGARLAEAAAARAAGQEDWWKLREAALFAVGTVSDQITQLAGGGRACGLGCRSMTGTRLFCFEKRKERSSSCCQVG